MTFSHCPAIVTIDDSAAILTNINIKQDTFLGRSSARKKNFSQQIFQFLSVVHLSTNLRKNLECSACSSVFTRQHFLHSYDSYDSTNLTPSPLPTRQARKFQSPFNQMQKSTGQFTPSCGQALSPLVRLVRLDYLYTESFANTTSQKISKSP